MFLDLLFDDFLSSILSIHSETSVIWRGEGPILSME